MSCNIFETQVTRDSKGKIQKVTNPQGRESSLYNDILDHLANNPEEPSLYDGEYISSLIKEGHIQGESMVKAPIEEIALAYYSKIYTPTFRNYYGEWQTTGNQNEPTFNEASSLLFGRVVENNLDNTDLTYDPSVLTDAINPMIDEIIQEGMSVGEIQELLNENGLTAPESVINRSLELRKTPNKSKSDQIKEDIRSEKYSKDTLKALYAPYGYKASDVDSLVDTYNNPKQSQSVGSLKEDDDFENMTDEEQSEAIVRAVKNSVPNIIMDLFVSAKEGLSANKSALKISNKGDLSRAYRNFTRNNIIPKKGSGRGAQVKLLMLSLNQLLPSLKATGMEITLHDNSSTYLKALEKEGLGDPQHFNTSGFVSGKQIHIHVVNPLLDGSVAAHEVLHPTLEQMFVDNPELYNKFKQEVESDSTIRETYVNLNEDATLDPSLEEIINYVANNLTEDIVKKYSNLPPGVSLEEVRAEELEGDSLFGADKSWYERWASQAWLLFNKLVHKLKKVLNIANKEAKSFDEIMNSQSTGRFMVDLRDHVLSGRPMKTKAIHNTQVRFSSTTSQEDTINNIIAMHESLVDNDGNPSTSLMLTAKKLGLSEAKIKNIIEQMYVVKKEEKLDVDDADFITKDTFYDRVLTGYLGGDKRKSRTLKAYLDGKIRDVMTDEMMNQIYRAYLQTNISYKTEDGKTRKRKPTHDEMARDLLSADLPIEVKFYMLSNLLAKNESYMDNDVSKRVADKLSSMRTQWGRMGRYLRDDNNVLFGGFEALVRAKNKEPETSSGKKLKQNIIEALQLTKEEVQGMLNQFNEVQIKSLFAKIRLLGTEGSPVDQVTAEEIRSVVMSSGLKILTEYGIDVSDIIARGGVQRSKGEDSPKKKVDLNSLSDKDMNKIMDAYIRVARGNVLQAQFLFENEFGEGSAKKHWKMNDTLRQNSIIYSKSHAFQAFNIGLDEVIKGTPATRRNPLLYTIRELLQANGYLQNEKGKPVRLSVAAKKLKNEIALDSSLLPNMLESAALNMSNMLLRDDTRKDPVKKSQLKRARAKAYSFLGKFTMNENDPNNVDATLESISSIVSREIRDTLTDFFSNPKASLNRSNLAMKLVYQMGLPESVALEVEKEVEDYIAATIKTEQKKNTLKKHAKDMSGADVEKIMQLASEGLLDDEMLAATFPEMFSKADAPLPVAVVTRLRKLRDDYIRANNLYERNKIFEEAKTIIRLEYADRRELIDSIINEMFYGHTLSGGSTMFNVLYGTLSYAGIMRLMQASSDVLYIIRNMVTDPKMSKRRLKLIQKSIGFQFMGYFTGEGSKAHIDRVKDIYTAGMADLKSLELERDPEQFAGFNLVTPAYVAQYKERFNAIKTMFKGTPSDVAKGAKMLIETFYSDDLGSDFANRKLSENQRRAIRFGMAAFPILLGSISVGFLSGGLATVGSFAAVAAVSPMIFSRTIMVIDYFFKDNIERQSVLRNAAAIIEEREGASLEDDQYFEQVNKVMGRDPESLRNMEGVIDGDLQYALEKYEDEYYEDKGKRPTVQEKSKFAKKFRRSKKVEMLFEYTDDYVRTSARRQANNQTFTALPAGQIGKIISDLNRSLSVQDPEDNKSTSKKNMSFVAKTLLKLGFIPFANVMGHVINTVFDSTVGYFYGMYQGSDRRNLVRQWNPQEQRYEDVEMSHNEIKNQTFRRLLGGTGMVMALSVAGMIMSGKDDEDELLDPSITPAKYKNSFEIWGKRYRVTGSGQGASYGEMQRMGDYDPHQLQIFNEETGKYENLLNLSNNIVPGLLLAPLGLNTDKELFGSRSLKDRDMESWSTSFMDVLGLYGSLTFGQGFNQSAELSLKAAQSMMMSSDMEEYERRQAQFDFLSQFTKPVQSLVSSNMSKQVYRTLNTIQGAKRKTFLDEQNRDQFSSYVFNQFSNNSPLIDPSLDNVLRDPLGHPIYENYTVSEETKAALNAIFGDRFDENRMEIPLYKVLDKDTRMPRPSGSGMKPQSRNEKKGYEYDLPGVVSNTVYSVSRSYRSDLMERRSFVNLMDKIMEKNVTDSDIKAASDYIDWDNYASYGDFMRRVNDLRTDNNYAIAKQIMASTNSKAAESAKVEVMKDILVNNLSAERLRSADSWSDITDYMAEKNLAIYQDGEDLVFSERTRNANKVKIPMEKIEMDLRELVQISNSRIPVYETNVNR